MSLQEFYDYIEMFCVMVTIASGIAAATPTPKDDTIVGYLYKIVDILAFNFGYAKRKPGEPGPAPNILPALLAGMVALAVGIPEEVQALELPERKTSATYQAEAFITYPDRRENGDALPDGEIGGFEVVYECSGGEGGVVAESFPTTTTKISSVSGSCEFAAAVFDTSGLYSSWTPVQTAQFGSGSGPAPPQLSLIQRIIGWIRSIFSDLS